MRTKESYDYHCSLLDGPLYKEDSTTYGINFSSSLNDLKAFHVVEGLPQDVLFEGVMPYEFSIMIRNVVVKKFLTLNELNDCIESYLYSPLEAKDKPSPVRQAVIASGSNVAESCELFKL